MLQKYGLSGYGRKTMTDRAVWSVGNFAVTCPLFRFYYVLMLTYRPAQLTDAEPIAHLHSQSWQRHYRGIWSDAFLNGPVLGNRRGVWQQRLAQPAPNQYVVVAEIEGELVGFACAYAHHDATWGTLLDNLHVRPAQQGRGIGRELMRLVARWSYGQDAASGLYLWVLAQNTPARRFYERSGATDHETISMQNPDGTFSATCRYVWPAVTQLF